MKELRSSLRRSPCIEQGMTCGSQRTTPNNVCWKCRYNMTLEECNEDRAPLRPLNQSKPEKSPSNRNRPMIHPCVDPPVCEDCQKLELSFFDPGCPGCHDILVNPNTKVPEIFAILRQWTPQTQLNLDLLVNEILKRGGHINDRDGLTDMTLLHYASKSGAAGIGDPDLASEVVSMLLSQGADPNIRCRWTNMTALHYAAYFDVVPVIKILLKATKALDIDSRCTEFDNGTALHIAASNLAHEAVKVLLQNGANSLVKDDMDRKPLDCIPDPTALDCDPDMPKTVMKLKKTLQEADSESDKRPPPNYDLVQSKVTLQALGINLGDKVVVGGIKTGTLRYCGPTEFASGVWAGIDLDDEAGKNDGSIGGISYFNCSPKHGIFAPISKISKPGSVVKSAPSPVKQAPVNQGNVDVSHVTSKVDSGMLEKAAATSTPRRSSGLSKSRTSSISSLAEIEVGDRVIVAGQRKGTIKFVGETKFAPGIWYGIELDRAAGKNDGSVNGMKYFTCKMKHGVFAPLSRIQKISRRKVSAFRLRLGDKRFSSNESLETISWGAVSERVDKRASGPSHLRDGRPRTPNKRPKSGTPDGIMRTPGSSSNFKLEVGMSVFCNNELGNVRYIGPTDFGDGIWVGVELRTAKGKNDGSVQGKRYFSCKNEHGLIVRPNKITVRGINGAKLVSEMYGQTNSETTHTNGDVK
ncbi:CAP-Gly domain-containing linker protein 3-like isoform X3 [Ruditapes philippinarum]|uniref:CAP-Gly domain-containing linker protein 3-like isoform X3 n=1 Tax=Ruditapes philippinarum TaxID=129788 RepID=UPI00295BF864|nr:CAP-Gly domain-containing linker protein 3-like isoform X3 [Ruditapes philippinarum]